MPVLNGERLLGNQGQPMYVHRATTFTQAEWRYTHQHTRPHLVYMKDSWHDFYKERIHYWESRGFRFDIDHNNSQVVGFDYQSVFGPVCDGSCWDRRRGVNSMCRQLYCADLVRRG